MKIDKGSRYVASSMQRTATFCFVTAAYGLVLFAASLLLSPPQTFDGYAYLVEGKATTFLVQGRWWFLLSCTLFVAAGLHSVRKANLILGIRI